jgi:alanine dehydrogenase
MRSLTVIALLGALAGHVSAHAKITTATGNAGGKGSAIGIVPGTAGTSEADVTVFQGGACGKTPGAGANNIATGTAAVASQNGGLPQVSAGGSVSMTLHQVNGVSSSHCS